MKIRVRIIESADRADLEQRTNKALQALDGKEIFSIQVASATHDGSEQHGVKTVLIAFGE